MKHRHTCTSSIRRRARSKIESSTLARRIRDGHTKRISDAFSVGCASFASEVRLPNVEAADAGGDAPNMAATVSHGVELCTPASKNALRKIVVARGSSTIAVGMLDGDEAMVPGSGDR